MPDNLTCLLRKLYVSQEKQQLETNMEQWAGSKAGKEYLKAVYCHPAYLTYMQSTSCEMLTGFYLHPNWMLSAYLKLSIYADNTTLMAESEDKRKSLLMRVKEETQKAGLKLKIQKWRSWYLVPSFHGK